MTDEQRTELAVVIARSAINKVVVTHGTDTMYKTAVHIASLLAEQRINKKVVLTGAMVPYSLGDESDALPNLATSIASFERVPSVYLLQ